MPPCKKATKAAPVEEEAPASPAPASKKRGAPTPSPKAKAKAAAATVSPAKKVKRTIKPDEQLADVMADIEVYEDYGVTLNQTNIGANNNKFYIIQLLKQKGTQYYTWNRWGRVGETGQSKLQTFGDDLAGAQSDFAKKFKDKTGNAWDNRADFQPKSGKYTLVDMAGEEEEEEAAEVPKALASPKKSPAKSRQQQDSKVAPEVQKLLKMIFDHDMFKDQMQQAGVDVNKMPLGKLSKAQMKKGYEVLEELQGALKSGNKKSLEELSSKFYTIVPHNFGRNRPPVIDSEVAFQKECDLLNTLNDIEIATALESKADSASSEEDPLMAKYRELRNDITPLDMKGEEAKLLVEYFNNTIGEGGFGGKTHQVEQIFCVDREGEKERINPYKSISNRKLLWHGTKAGVVAAILASGLRIMPHAGGRVGRGLYFASEAGKSSGYVWPAQGYGIMFLNEVVLGKEHSITKDDSSLRAPPTGFDSVVARGRTEPEPKHDVTIKKEFGDITVPKGKPVNTEHKSSSFFQSEYLVYSESQVYTRYLLLVKWPW